MFLVKVYLSANGEIYNYQEILKKKDFNYDVSNGKLGRTDAVYLIVTKIVTRFQIMVLFSRFMLCNALCYLFGYSITVNPGFR